MRRRYGASPVHLLAHLAAFALVGWALLQVIDARAAGNIALWFAGAIVLHDLVVLPAYTALDRLARRATGPAINYLRVPALGSALLLALFFPLICGRSTDTLAFFSGSDPGGYAGRWLLVSGLLFAGSLALYVIRARGSAGPPPGR